MNKIRIGRIGNNTKSGMMRLSIMDFYHGFHGLHGLQFLIREIRETRDRAFN
jgi:hypothetical protein